MRNSDLKFFANDNDLARAAASEWVDAVGRSPKQTVAFSGGKIATPFFAAITDHAKAKNISLAEVDFFWADERCVPPADPESNFLVANEILFKPLGMKPDRIHRLRGELEQAAAVAEANAEIIRIAPRNSAGMPVLDIIILGLGPDGHTASLFPNASEAVIGAQAAYLAIDNSPKPPPQRITLTFAAIAAAKQVWMLASGTGKEKALAESLAPDGKTPFARVLRSRTQTRIFSDIRL